MDYKFIVLGLVILFLIVLVWRLSRTNKLEKQIIAKYSAKIRKTEKLDPAHAIIESHKIFVAALSHLFQNKKITAAQKITKVQEKLPNIRSIWLHHTLRNRVAHETDVHISQNQATKARADFVKALESLG